MWSTTGTHPGQTTKPPTAPSLCCSSCWMWKRTDWNHQAEGLSLCTAGNQPVLLLSDCLKQGFSKLHQRTCLRKSKIPQFLFMLIDLFSIFEDMNFGENSLVVSRSLLNCCLFLLMNSAFERPAGKIIFLLFLIHYFLPFLSCCMVHTQFRCSAWWSVGYNIAKQVSFAEQGTNLETKTHQYYNLWTFSQNQLVVYSRTKRYSVLKSRVLLT